MAQFMRNKVVQRASVTLLGSAVVGVYYIADRYGDNFTTKSQLINNRKHEVRNVSTEENTMTLKSVQVFFRHGARTPLRHVPGLEEVVYDKNKLFSPLPHMEIPCKVQHLNGGPRPDSPIQNSYAVTQFKGGVGAGELTNVGKNQAYLLGARLAKRYSKLIEHGFNQKDFIIRSTNINRCIQSMQCVLAGMFGYTSDLENFVINVDHHNNEILYPALRKCQNFRKLSERSQEILESQPNYINLVKKIQKHTGVKPDISKLDMMQVRDNVVAREAHGLPVPKFLIDLFPEIDKAAIQVLLTVVCGNVQENPRLGLSLSIGRLLHLVTENIKLFTEVNEKHKNKHKSQYKVALYSCHDSSLVPMLAAMGCYDSQWPSYAADISIELHEDNKGQHWVKVSYCDKDMTLRGCSSPLITVDQFLDVIKPYTVIPREFELLCEDPNILHKGSDRPDGAHPIKQYEAPPNI